EQNLGSDHLLIAEYLVDLSEILQAANRLGEAEESLRRALAIERGQNQASQLRIARELARLADVLLAMNCLRESESLLLQAATINREESLRMGRLAPETRE